MDDFWDRWTDAFLESESEEEDSRLEDLLAAHDEAEDEAELEKMLRDLDDPPRPATVERARRRPRKATLASVAKQAARAGLDVARYEVEPDGKISVVTGKDATSTNPWDAEIERLTKQ
jgi:hypothetical protein